MFRTAFMNVAGVHEEPKKGSYEWKKEHMTPQQLARTMDNAEKYNGVSSLKILFKTI